MMEDRNGNEIAVFKLAQLNAVPYRTNNNVKVIQNILENGGDINCAVPANPFKIVQDEYFVGSNALHLARPSDDGEVFEYLLNQGADFTKKSEDGQTILHKMFTSKKSEYFTEPSSHLLIDAVLLAHVSTNNPTNPCNKDSFSHFHIACTTRNASVIEFFLENGVLVDESVNANSELLPGYTPLHIASMYTNTKVIEILLAHGANMHIANADGKTPLHILIERRIEMFDRIGKVKNNVEWYNKLLKQIQENDKIINMLMENMSTDIESVDSIGLSSFHVACMLQDLSVAENLADRVTDINQCINKDSPVWPGYTAMHFAAHFDISHVEMLMKKRANIEVKDSNGLTPLDICIERYKIEEIHKIMSINVKWRRIVFSDGKTKLLAVIHALTNRAEFENIFNNSNVNMKIPLRSSLWPGYTPLHLAIHLHERGNGSVFRDHTCPPMDLRLIRYFLKEGADLNVQDNRGRTVLHLAFRLNKLDIVEKIFNDSVHIPNVSDEDSLSHLHIALAIYNKCRSKLKKFILNNVEVNMIYKGTSAVNFILPGFTPLHIAIYQMGFSSEFKHKVRVLLTHGADLYTKDIYGLTPIHWLLKLYSACTYETEIKYLLKNVTNDSVIEEYGLSYLHIACLANDSATAKRLIRNGSNVNLAIKYNRQDDKKHPLSFLSKLDKCKPLHLNTLCFRSMETFLLKQGADVFAKKANGSTPLEYSPVLQEFLSKVQKNVALQQRMKQEYGWTKLHCICYSRQLDELQNVINENPTDVNAQVFSNSPIWKGYTPLHLLMNHVKMYSSNADEIIYPMSRILLENGADVTVIDDKHNTPLGMLFEYFRGKTDNEQSRLLIRHHTNFNVNPVNEEGISHFHIACFLNDIIVVQGFLRHGVDVNYPIDYFINDCPGYTPLHLASKLEMIDLLIDHGADIHIEDVKGFTALHTAIEHDPFDEGVIKKLIESGAEVNRANYSGITPFEALLTSRIPFSAETLRILTRHGFLINSCNPITGVGYLSMISSRLWYTNRDSYNSIVDVIIAENSSNSFGRTTLHHLVTCLHIDVNYCIEVIEKLIKAGHDIDEQDNEGKTALHLAIDYKNSDAVQALLISGADINVRDKNGNSALSHALTKPTGPYESINNTLTAHAYRLIFLKLELNQIDAHFVLNGLHSFHAYVDHHVREQISLSKEIQVGVRSISLYDFLSETGTIMVYPSLNHDERCKLDEQFNTLTKDDRLRRIRAILMLQYRKAVKRPKLLLSALNSLRLLLGFNFPDLCATHVFQYLGNSDLKSLIHANIETEQVNMDVD